MMNKYISPIAVDLGAKHTGVVFTHYIEGAEPISHKGVTFVLDVNNFKVSQKDRLVNRHRMRGEQRRKLAKRLFFIILEKEYGLKQEQSKIWEFVRGLLNRRGFTYLQENNEEEEVTVPLEFAKYIFPNEFRDYKEDVLKFIREQAEEDVQKALTFWKKLLGKESTNEEKEELEKRLHSFLVEQKGNEDYNKKKCDDILKQIKNTASGLIKEIEQGNKPRPKYLEEIWTDIQSNLELEKLLSKASKKISQKEFYHLIGHISNMQLRGIRKYFNDEKMAKENDYWDEKRLTKHYVRWLKSWHVPKDKPSKQHQADLIRQVEKENKSVLQLFFDNDPKTSIPPYEDQNNRRIPTCQSLLLSATYLDEHYKGWREIVTALAKRNETDEFGNVFQKTFDFYDETSIQEVLSELTKSLQGYHHNNQKENKNKVIPFDRDSILFQRILETSMKHDLYMLRNLVREDNPEKVSSFKRREYLLKDLKSAGDNLNLAIDQNQKSLLLIIAKRFYEEVKEAKAGLWDKDNSLLAKCDAKPKHKNKMKQEVVEQILGVKFDSIEEEKNNLSFKDFLNFWEKENPDSKSKSIAKLCDSIEEIRKSYGTHFNFGYELFTKKLNKLNLKTESTLNLDKIISEVIEKKNFTKEFVNSLYETSSKNLAILTEEEKERQANNRKDKEEEISDFKKVFLKQKEAVKEIKKFLNHNESQAAKYDNPFSLAQLANILEGGQSGFYKICPACEKENAWRSQMELTGRKKLNKPGALVAKGARLSADTGKPFDGQIDRIVTKLAKEVAVKKIEQIKNNFMDGDNIELPILMENNQFTFTAELFKQKSSARLKPDEKSFKRNLKKLRRNESRLDDKDTRIKKDSAGICPYTGESIGSDGQIDHIIARSLTKGTILNSELNLLYASQKGNQQKDNKRYSLDRIHTKFIESQFKVSTTEAMRAKIEAIVKATLKEEQNKIVADALSSQQRIAFKLALLDEELRELVLPFLQTHSKALVNGTQAWFFKRLRKELDFQIKNIFPKSEIKIRSYYFGVLDDDSALQKLRKELTIHNSNYAKPKNETQPEGSHIIDASMLFAHSLLLSDKNKGFLKSPLLKDKIQNEGEWLENLLPEEIEIKYIERKPKYRKENPESNSLFKAGMYAERFLSLLVDNNGIRFGFTSAPDKASDPIESKYNEEIFSKLKPFLLYKGEFVQEDFEYYSKLAVTPKYSLLKLHRNKVKEYLQTCSKEDELGNFLESMRYITENVPIFKEEEKKKDKNKQQDLENKSDKKEKAEKRKVLFVENPIKVDKKGKAQEGFFEKKKPFNLKLGKIKIPEFKILMPYVDEWKKLKEFLKDVKQDELEQKAKEYFHAQEIRNPSISNPFKHNTTGRKLSLPVESSPSGGFRIQRTNEFDEKIYQVQTGESPYIGFEVKANGQVNFSNSIPAKNYFSGNVTSYKLEDKILSDDFVYFDEWRILKLTDKQISEGIQEIRMAPGTKARCYIKVKIASSVATNFFFSKKDDFSFMYKMKMRDKKDKEGFDKLSKFLEENIYKQRDTITITKINVQYVELRFVTESSGIPAKLQTLYNQGTKVENP